MQPSTGWLTLNAVLAGFASLLAFACAAQAEEKTKSAPAPKALPILKDFSLGDSSGKPCTLKDICRHKFAVLFFMGTECPVSNFYAPVIEQIAKRYADRGVSVYGVIPDQELTAAEAAKHALEYRLTFRILLDPKLSLAHDAGVEIVPQAAVVSPTGQILYRGRIDDRYSLDGKRRDDARVKDLELALEALLAGKIPPTQETKTFGCPLPEPVPPSKR